MKFNERIKKSNPNKWSIICTHKLTKSTKLTKTCTIRTYLKCYCINNILKVTSSH